MGDQESAFPLWPWKRDTTEVSGGAFLCFFTFGLTTYRMYTCLIGFETCGTRFVASSVNATCVHFPFTVTSNAEPFDCFPLEFSDTRLIARDLRK